jgi:hypothetical protein
MICIGHQADLCQPPGQFDRRTDMGRQRRHTVGQCRIISCRFEPGPVRRCSRIKRQVKIIAQRRAKRGLVAAVDLDLLDHRREKVRALTGIEHAGNGLCLGFDRIEPGSCFRHRLACPGFRLAGSFKGGLDARQCRLGFAQRLFGGLGLGALGRRIGQSGNALGDPGKIGVLAGDLPLKPGLALAGFADDTLELGALGGGFGALCGDNAQAMFRFRRAWPGLFRTPA